MSPGLIDAVVLFIALTTAVGLTRCVIGPSTADRLVGLNIAASQLIVIFVYLALKENLSVYLDVALVYAVFGFVGTLAIAHLLSQKGTSQ